MGSQERDLTIGQALDLGVQLAIGGRHESAIGLFRGVLVHEPENFEAIERLGASLFEIKRVHEALYYFWRGRKLNRKHPMALTNYGLTVCELGHPEEGLADLERAALLADRMPDLSLESKALCWNNLGNTLEKLHRYGEALIALDKGVRYNPNDSFPHYNRGVVLLRLNRHAEGIKALERAIAINPQDADAHYNRGMARLLSGDFKGGFADYEYRLVTSSNEVINLGLPSDKKWTGADNIEGKTILVHCEQGLGDDIQFLRFIRPLLDEKKPAQILLITHSAIRSLVGDLPVTVLDPSAALPVYDCWVALMSLPLCLGTLVDTIPLPWVPVIEPERIEKWRVDLALPSDKLNIGVCWAGNFQHKNDRHRSIDLPTFAKLFGAEGVNFVSLQQMRPGEAEIFKEIKATHPHLSAYFFDDLRDTGAAMLNLDAVISVDTAVAHLAATLGIHTHILVPAFGTDWRWMLDRDDSPWYPWARIWRQPKINDWKTVIGSLRAELEEVTRRKH